jgi:hypothetical protein
MPQAVTWTNHLEAKRLGNHQPFAELSLAGAQTTLPVFSAQKTKLADERIDAIETFLETFSRMCQQQQDELHRRLGRLQENRIGPDCKSEDTAIEDSGFTPSEDEDDLKDREKQVVSSIHETDAAAVECIIQEDAGVNSGSELELLRDSYEIQESIWDLSIFIGFEELGLLGSAYIAFLLAVNTFMQLGLCAIINQAFTQKEFGEDTVQAMIRWRTYSGHSFDLVDKHTFESLASRVCGFDLSIPMSGGVPELLTRIDQYYLPSRDHFDTEVKPGLGKLLPYVQPIGQILCILALIIWLLNLAGVMRQIFQLGQAILRMKGKEIQISARHSTASHVLEKVHVHTSEIRLSDGERELVAMSEARKLFCFLVLGLQCCVVTLLGITGWLYMIYTLDLRDLLLNCSALTIVLDLDELIFRTLAPKSAIQFLTSLKSLPLPRPRTLKGLNLSPIVRVLSVVAVVVPSIILMDQQIDILKRTREAICGGNTEFVSVSDKAGIIAAGVSKFDWEAAKTSYFYRGMRQLIGKKNIDGSIVETSFGGTSDNNDVSYSAAVSGMVNSQWSLTETLARNTVDVMDYWNAACEDLVPQKQSQKFTKEHGFLMILRDTIGNRSIDSCSEVKRHCSGDDPKGVSARQFCPDTCGCNDAASGQILGGINGCPTSCLKSQKYNLSMFRECKDVGLTSGYWQKFAEGLDSLKASYPKTWISDFPESTSLILNHGCGAIFKNLSFMGAWPDPCELSPIFVQPLAFACPETCQCKIRKRQLCPKTC